MRRQTRARVVEAQTRTPDKIVSIFEPWAQIIRKGKLDRPTEIEVVVKVQEAEGGIVTDVAVDDARADALLLVPAVEHHQRLFGRVPATVATDRGFYSGRGERRLYDMGSNIRCFPGPGTGPASASRMNDSAGSSEDAPGEPGAKRASPD